MYGGEQAGRTRTWPVLTLTREPDCLVEEGDAADLGSGSCGPTMPEVRELYGILCMMIKTESYDTCWDAHATPPTRDNI